MASKNIFNHKRVSISVLASPHILMLQTHIYNRLGIIADAGQAVSFAVKMFQNDVQTLDFSIPSVHSFARKHISVSEQCSSYVTTLADTYGFGELQLYTVITQVVAVLLSPPQYSDTANFSAAE